MKIKNSIVYAFMGCVIFSQAMADPSPFVIDVDTELYTSQQVEKMGEQLNKMDAQFDELQSQTDQLRSQTYSLTKEITNIGKFTDTADIQTLLKKVDALIKQADSYSENIYQDGSQFSKNYQGYNTEDKTLPTPDEANEEYRNRANTTLQTIKNSNDAIEKDLNDTDSSPENISSVINSATKTIAGASGTNQAVGGLAEIDAQILKELQQIHTQLAAMTESQNAVGAEKIQDDEKTIKDAKNKLDSDAVPVEVSYGSYPLKLPNF